MQGAGAYHFSSQGPFSNIVDNEKTHRFFKLHIQSWIYIHCAISMITSIIAIAIGVIFLTKAELHQYVSIYKLTLAYMRRDNPRKYWLIYRIFFGCWIFVHFLHLATILFTIAAIQKRNTYMLKPQLLILIFQLGLFIIGSASLLVLSVTGSKIAWDLLLFLSFYIFVVSTNLYLLANYHRFLDDKITELNDLLSQQAKTVHFKEASTTSS